MNSQTTSDFIITPASYVEWNLLKMLAQKHPVILKGLARQIYDASLASFYPSSHIHTYAQWLEYENSNFHGGNNSSFRTYHENMFHSIFPYLRSQISFGTGKNGYKIYGVKRYVADFVDTDNQVIIEIDGQDHQTYQGYLRDKIRDYFFETQNYMTVRFTNDEVDNLYKIYLTLIAEEIENEYIC